jgi:rod shape-determining protein MreD
MPERIAMSFPSLISAAIPFLCAIFGVVLSSIPLSLVSNSLPSPLLGLMPIYFWSLARPDLMPAAAVLVIGVAEDLFSGSPPGLWTASFVASYAFLDRQKDSFAGLAGIAAVLGFAVTALIATATAYVIFWIYAGHAPPVTSLALQLATSVLFYIPAAGVMDWIHRHMVGAKRSEF